MLPGHDVSSDLGLSRQTDFQMREFSAVAKFILGKEANTYRGLSDWRKMAAHTNYPKTYKNSLLVNNNLFTAG